MSPKAVLTSVLLAAGLALAGCTGSTPPAQDAASRSTATPSVSGPATSSAAATAGAPARATEPAERPSAPADAPAPPAPEPAAPAPSETPVRMINPPGQEPAVPENPLPPRDVTYEEAYANWQNGMPYYDAFCLHYQPVTPAGVAQCEGIRAGTVDGVTGEYIGG